MTIEKYKEPFLFLLNEFKPVINGIISDIRKQSGIGLEMRSWFKKEGPPKGIIRNLKFSMS